MTSALSRQGPRVLLVLLALMCAGCGYQPSSTPIEPARPGILRIVSSLPSKGLYLEETKLTRGAIDTAIKQHALRGGIALEHIALEGGSDETGEWTRAVEERNARAAAEDPSVVAYIGPHNSGAAAFSLPITNRAGMLHSSPSATWPGLTQAGWDDGAPDKYFPGIARNFVRIAPPDSVLALAAATWFAQDGLRRPLVLQDGSTYSEAMARAFASPLGGSPVAQVDTAVETVTLPPLDGHEGIFFAPSSVQSASRLAQALRGTTLPVYASDVALDPHFLEVSGEMVARWHIVSNTGPLAEPVAALYPDIPEEVAASRPAMSAYIITRLTIESINSGARDRAGVLNHARLKRLPDGRSLFSNGGDPTAWTVTGYRAENGVFRAAKDFSP